jgi:hypothetical protein
MANLTLTTSRYTEPGAYVGQILNPESTNLSADARIPAIIAKGSRLAVAKNSPIIRAFIQGEQLTFSNSAPYVALLLHEATGAKLKPNRLFKQDGTELRQEEWQYLSTGGKYLSIQIRDESFDALATYYLDYQSNDRAVQDPIPVSEIRQIRFIGNQLDSSQYTEYKDYFVPASFSPVTADAANVHPAAYFGTVAATLQPGSTGSALVSPTASFVHAYSRKYTVTCTSASGAVGSRTATFHWTATPLSGGNYAAPPVPLAALDTFPTFTINETGSLSGALEFGLALDFNFNGANFVAGDSFVVTAHGPGMVEIDSRYGNAQFATIETPYVVGGFQNDFRIQINPEALYTHARNNKYRIKLMSVSGVTPARVMQFVWARYGDVLPISGSFTVTENNLVSLSPTLVDGVKLDFVIGPTAAAVGTTWEIVAKAPRIYYTAKDAREYKLTLQAPIVAGDAVTLFGGFSTSTTEGRFGTFTAEFDPLVAGKDGYALLPDNVSIAFRNTESYATLDIFEYAIFISNVLDWSLKAKTEDIRQLTDYKTDMNGQITGVAGQRYLILSKVPTDHDSIRVKNYNTNAEISFNWVFGTPFVYFTVDPAVAVKVTYTSKGAEPDPGQAYYLTTLFLRPESFYNTPYLVLRLEDGRNFAAPSAVDNDLYIGNEIAWNNNAPGVYLIQPKNTDGSGVYSIPDFVAAVQSVKNYPRITDLCLLNYPAALSEVLNQNLIGNDPFEQRPNLVWFGMPIGTPIGDENTEGTLVFTARKTLQVAGDSAAHGSRILVAPTRATKTIVLDNGLTTTVTLDGSFVALAGAARVASFADPATDLLGQLVNGFDTIEMYRKDQIMLLGQAQINYVNGSPGVYTWGEDMTVDTAKDFNLIQVMTQRHFVTKVVVREMASLVGITPASGTAAKSIVRGKLASILRGLLARGLIGQYQDADGNDRNFDPTKDIIVFQDKNDPTLFYFNYAWYSRNVIKRLFGLYALNSNDFSTGVALK